MLRKRNAAFLLMMATGCDLERSRDVKFCDKWLSPMSTIYINKSTGMSRFDDVSGQLKRCDVASICISFPIVLKLNSLSDIKNIRGQKYIIIEEGRNRWEFGFSNSLNIEYITIHEDEYQIRTTYRPCSGGLNLKELDYLNKIKM